MVLETRFGNGNRLGRIAGLFLLTWTFALAHGFASTAAADTDPEAAQAPELSAKWPGRPALPGSLMAMIEPAGARTAGALWRVDGFAWQTSGTPIVGLPPGMYTVSFKAIQDWTTPAHVPVAVPAGEIVTLTRHYSRTGSIYRFERKWPLLAQPRHFDRPHDVAVGPDGMVYVADSDAYKIQKFDPAGRQVTAWGEPGDAPGQFVGGPLAVAVAPDGTVYVADTDRVQHFEGSGERVDGWDGFERPGGIAVGPDGSVYVVDVWAVSIYRFSATGEYLDAWAPSGGMNLLGDVDVSSDGTVWIVTEASTGDSSIQQFSASGTFLDEWYFDGGFTDPGGVAVAPNGNVYVADTGNNRIQYFDPTGALLGQWGGLGKAAGQVNYPQGLAVGPNGMVYVADTENHRIQRFTPDGTFLGRWAGAGSGNGEFDDLQGVAVAPGGTVYVADTDNHRIQYFDANGHYQGQWGTPGTGNSQFASPRDVAVSPDGTTVYVADTDNHRIQYFDAVGSYQGQWNDGDGALYNPKRIAAGPNGDVYVGHEGEFRLLRFGPSGAFQNKWAFFESMGMDLDSVGGLAIAPDGTVYATDSGAGISAVRRYDAAGTPLGEWGNFVALGVAVTSDGLVHVGNQNAGRIERFTPEGTFIDAYGSPGTGNGQFNGIAGLAAGPDDSVYVADNANHRIQQFQRVFVMERPKAVVVAGKGDDKANDLWPATEASANYAYNALLGQGFTKDTIHYLSYNTDLDLDQDGEPDVDADCTLDELENALKQWAPDGTGGPPTGDVVLYMVDHGGSVGFGLNRREILSQQELADWLNALQSQIQGKVTVMIDACHSGHFINPLSNANRIIIASASPQEEALFQGGVSFSDYFWTQVLLGENVKDSYDTAVEGRAAQTPMLTGEDLARNTHIGTGAQNAANAPLITATRGDHTLTGQAATELWADVTDPQGVSRVWVVVQPPDCATTSGYPARELSPDPGVPNRWKSRVDLFTTNGTYTVLVYARDARGFTCAPERIEVTVNEPLRRKVLIVAGCADASGARRQGIEFAAEYAYTTLKRQGYGGEDIRYLSGSGTQGVYGLPTWDNVRSAIEVWAASQTQDLVVYFVGDGAPGVFTLSPAEEVTALELDGWLDTLQGTLPGSVVVLCDSDYAGAFLGPLKPPSGKKRILMTSSASYRKMRMLFGGAASFSTYFWSRVYNGAKVRKAWDYASIAMGDAVGAVTALDDTGDGQCVAGEDGNYAAQYRIGLGMLRAGDIPIINDIVPPQTINGTDEATLWVEDVTATAGIDQVLLTIQPPGYDEVDPKEWPVFELDHVGNNRYEQNCSAFPHWGEYKVTVIAIDQDGQVSLPATTTVLREDGPDTYEDDDIRDRANWIGMNAAFEQRHNFHDQGDEDWVLFYAWQGQNVTVETHDLDTGADTFIELCRDDGTVVDSNDNRTPLDLSSRLVWEVDADAFYYVRVTDTADGFGAGTGYDLKVWRETAPGASAAVSFTILNAATGVTVPGATIEFSGVNPYLPWFTEEADTLGVCNVGGLEDGTYQYKITADGFAPAGPLSLPLSEGQTQPVTVQMTPNPATASVTVLIEPAAARNAGGRWRVDGGAWQVSGATVEGLSEGVHTVSFKAVAGWNTPAPQTGTLSAGQGASVTATYTPSGSATGSLKVVIEPAAVCSAGALWRVDGGAWQISGATVGGLTEGAHGVTFSVVANWYAPPPATVEIAADQTVSLLRTYESAKGQDRKSAVEWLGTHVAEEVLPLDVEGAQGATVAPDARLAVRVAAEDAILPESVWAVAETEGWSCADVHWRVTDANDGRDGWAVLTPETPMPVGAEVSVSAGAETIAGDAVGPVTYWFRVAEDGAGVPGDVRLEVAAPGEPLPAVMARPVGDAYRIVPEGVYDEAIDVLLPGPADADASMLSVYYRSESARHRGWYEAEHVHGWLDGVPELVEEDRQTWLLLRVHHSGVVQLGQRVEAEPGGLLPVALTGQPGKWLVFLGCVTAVLVLLARTITLQGAGRQAN